MEFRFNESYSQPSSSAPLLGVLLAATLSVNKPQCVSDLGVTGGRRCG